MITLEEVEHRLSEANEALKLYKEQQAKKQSEPCPLEEGKQVGMDQEKNSVWVTEHGYSGSVSVERDPEDSDVDSWCVVLRYPFGEKEPCLEEARKMIGGKTD